VLNSNVIPESRGSGLSGISSQAAGRIPDSGFAASGMTKLVGGDGRQADA